MRKIFKKIWGGGGVKSGFSTRAKTSLAYVDYLRSCGCDIGSNTFFQSPQTACVDTTRPSLVTIGNNCTFLANFILLTHDNVTKCLGNVPWKKNPPPRKKVPTAWKKVPTAACFYGAPPRQK